MTIQEIKQLAAQFLISYPGSAVGRVLAVDSAGTGLEWVTASGLSNDAPTASGVSITGTLQVGQLLTGHYTYADTEGEPELNSVKKWYRADDNTGTNLTAISGATSITYTLQSADLGKFIKFGVTPKAQFGTMIGTEVFSSYTTAIAANSIANVWLIAGQSNAQGEAAPYDLFSPYRNADVLDTEMVWNHGSSVMEKLAVSSFGTSNNGGAVDSGINKVGSEMALMRKLAETSGSENVYLVKHAVGATPLHDISGTDTWYPSHSGGLLDQFITRVLAAKTNLEGQGKTVVFKGMLWVQGETDSWDAESTANYQTNLEALYTKVNTQLGITNLPFVVYQIHNLGGGANNTQKGNIRTAQANFVASDTVHRFLVNCDPFKLRDAYHLDVDGYAFLGEQAATFLPFAGTYTTPTYVSMGAPAAAPTNLVIDNTAKTLGWTNNSLYTALSDYEYTFNGGGTAQVVSAKPITIPDRDFTNGLVGIRVKQAAGHDESPWLFNWIPFEKNVTGHVRLMYDYMNEVSQNDYYGSPLCYSSIPIIGSANGVGLKFQNVSGYHGVTVGIGSNNVNGTVEAQFYFESGNVSIIEGGTTKLTEAAVVGDWYRILPALVTNLPVYQKSSDGGTTWSTIYTSVIPINFDGYVKFGSASNSLISDVMLDTSQVPSDLIAYYAFTYPILSGNQIKGTIPDTSGNKRHLANTVDYLGKTAQGVSPFGKLGDWEYFGGAARDIRSGMTTGFSAGTGFSYTGWIIFDGSDTSAIVFQKDGEYILYYDNGSGEIRFGTYASSGNTGYVEAGKAMSKSTWHFVVARWDAANGVSISVDNGTPAVAAQATMYTNNNSFFKIASTVSGNRFSGALDCFRLWKKRLTDSEVTAWYNGGAGL